MVLLNRIFTTNQANQYRNDCERQKDVDKSSERIRGNESEHPQYEKNNGNGPQHTCESIYLLVMPTFRHAHGPEDNFHHSEMKAQ